MFNDRPMTKEERITLACPSCFEIKKQMENRKIQLSGVNTKFVFSLTVAVFIMLLALHNTGEK